MIPNRRILLAVALVLFFAIIVIVWYFFYAKPAIAPSIGGTNNPIPTRTFPPRFQFLNWKNTAPTGTSTTEVTDPLKYPLVEIWNKPATGQTFVVQDVLKDVIATTTVGTTTIEIKKSVHASSTVVMFVDKVTGYIYGYPLETGKVYQISNTVVPGVYDAYFFNNNKQVIMRYVDRDKNTSTSLIATIPTVPQTGTALPLLNVTNLSSLVTSIAVNGRKDHASYIVSTDNGSSIYTLSPKGVSLVASSPFKEWALSYGGESLFVTSKPSAYVGGAILKLPSFDIQTGNKTGLMSNANSSGEFLNSMWTKTGLATFITDDSGDRVLPFKTLASKCSWGEKDFLICAIPRTLPRGTEGLPDDWFQGRVTFTDDIFSIDKNTGAQFHFYYFTDSDGLFDVTNISIFKTNDIISFNKRQDGTLWLINTNFLPVE